MKGRTGHYLDGITKYKDPFWEVSCECGHTGWSLTCTDKCSKCGSSRVTCIPANKVQKKNLSS